MGCGASKSNVIVINQIENSTIQKNDEKLKAEVKIEELDHKGSSNDAVVNLVTTELPQAEIPDQSLNSSENNKVLEFTDDSASEPADELIETPLSRYKGPQDDHIRKLHGLHKHGTRNVIKLAEDFIDIVHKQAEFKRNRSAKLIQKYYRAWKAYRRDNIQHE